uniref:Uncharacterized protein n=1 Tax=Oryza brachyantha TaxID=4533 RepID=J3LR03_ORYBR
MAAEDDDDHGGRQAGIGIRTHEQERKGKERERQEEAASTGAFNSPFTIATYTSLPLPPRSSSLISLSLPPSPLLHHRDPAYPRRTAGAPPCNASGACLSSNKRSFLSIFTPSSWCAWSAAAALSVLAAFFFFYPSRPLPRRATDIPSLTPPERRRAAATELALRRVGDPSGLE